ncbi:hypothetical protein JRO89_XS07G0002300 [Xanthoceras sorbifolium]|uniref:NAD-dependent epimerase/dehydratase domain-containing protein n=1 Tax=Xanthoceras sorbifolium TaxID=99658 RepID=A0ABQ8HRK2_9ROSI|nr:hypothetical protein JRO89_XS07G0002300 [Xanthoceras sorbifolium]
MALEKGRVCVTGSGGYLASWVVKLLPSNDYFVHGTVREPIRVRDEKNAHLYKLEKASENLKLFKAELLDYNSISSAIIGCTGVFHVASPVEVVEPAVKGTLNVLKACNEAKVKRVVVVSSRAAVVFNHRWPKGQMKDETCWSDKEYCRTAMFTVNASSHTLINFLKEGYKSVENKLWLTVDVRDVAEALLLSYKKPEAEGRYISMAHTIESRDLLDRGRRANHGEFREAADARVVLQAIGGNSH